MGPFPLLDCQNPLKKRRPPRQNDSVANGNLRFFRRNAGGPARLRSARVVIKFLAYNLGRFCTSVWFCTSAFRSGKRQELNLIRRRNLISDNRLIRPSKTLYVFNILRFVLEFCSFSVKSMYGNNDPLNVPFTDVNF